MTKKVQISVPSSILQWALIVVLMILAPLSVTAISAQAPSRFLGTITSINGDTITIKTDAGQVYQVEVPSTASIMRVAPGQKDLSAAVTIQLSDLTTGDRALVRIDSSAAAGTSQAAQIITIKQADVALRQQKEREDWQVNGVGGLVKSVDTGTGTIVLVNGAGATMKTITIQTTPSTVLKRYAPASVRYDLAQPAPISAIQAGDQLRARGTKNADGTEVNAVEVVSGGFRNISGLIVSIDPSNSTLVVKDLLTKKPVTIQISPDAQMRNLDPRLAAFIAMRLKGGAMGGGRTAGGGQGMNGGGGGRQFAGAPSGGAGGPGRAGAMDTQQLLNRAEPIKFSDLQKGEAVMIVATEGKSDVTAITLVAGVEPLLEAPAASNLLSNWSLNSSAPDEAAAQ
jgi:hypothetical protein